MVQSRCAHDWGMVATCIKFKCRPKTKRSTARNLHECVKTVCANVHKPAAAIGENGSNFIQSTNATEHKQHERETMMIRNMQVRKMVSIISTAQLSVMKDVRHVSKLVVILLMLWRNKAGARPIVTNASSSEVWSVFRDLRERVGPMHNEG